MKAVQLYRQAATQGHAIAQNDLGYMYLVGRGVARDYSEALRLFRQAAAQGEPVAYQNLGVMYEYGHGVDQNIAEAQRWYAKAAETLPSDSDNLAKVRTAQQRIARQLATTQTSQPPSSSTKVATPDQPPTYEPVRLPGSFIQKQVEGYGPWIDFHSCGGITFSYALEKPPGTDGTQHVRLGVRNDNRFRVHVAFRPFFVSDEGESHVSGAIAGDFNPGTGDSWDQKPLAVNLNRSDYMTISKLGLRDIAIQNVERLVPNAYSQGEKLPCNDITVAVTPPSKGKGKVVARDCNAPHGTYEAPYRVEGFSGRPIAEILQSLATNMNITTAQSISCPPGQLCMGGTGKTKNDTPGDFSYHGDYIQFTWGTNSDDHDIFILRDIDTKSVASRAYVGHETDGSGEAIFQVKGLGSYWRYANQSPHPITVSDQPEINFPFTDGLRRACNVAQDLFDLAYLAQQGLPASK
jgi:hypothetical protein